MHKNAKSRTKLINAKNVSWSIHMNSGGSRVKSMKSMIKAALVTLTSNGRNEMGTHAENGLCACYLNDTTFEADMGYCVWAALRVRNLEARTFNRLGVT